MDQELRNTARGFLLGIVLGAALWAIILYVIFA